MTSRTAATFFPPVMEARRWVEGKDFADTPLINVSQAAPVDPPPAPLIAAMAEALHQADTHLYGPVLGLPELRAELAAQWSVAYNGTVSADHVAITSGCNQAFAAAIAHLCGEGDAIILPTPYYFNHKMWLDQAGVELQALPVGLDMLPSVADAAQRITDETKAIALVTPNNPCGVEYPSGLIEAFYDLAHAHGIALIIDETYRDFLLFDHAPHTLFEKPNWQDTLIQLYSFSKAFRLTGHRVGSIVAGPDRLQEIEKFLDTVTICPNQLGQKAALWGLQNLTDWLAGERLEILDRRAAISDHFDILKSQGWTLLGCGAYFAYVEHPFDMASDVLAKRLVDDCSVLSLPGTMFVPETDPSGQKQLRIAFANVDRGQIKQLFERLAAFQA